MQQEILKQAESLLFFVHPHQRSPFGRRSPPKVRRTLWESPFERTRNLLKLNYFYIIIAGLNINLSILNSNPRLCGDFNSCTPGRSRTLNLLIRSQTLYPVELRVQIYKQKCQIIHYFGIFIQI